MSDGYCLKAKISNYSNRYVCLSTGNKEDGRAGSILCIQYICP